MDHIPTRPPPPQAAVGIRQRFKGAAFEMAMSLLIAACGGRGGLRWLTKSGERMRTK